MANVGARKDLPLGDFGAFEGDMVVTGTLNFRGQRPARLTRARADDPLVARTVATAEDPAEEAYYLARIAAARAEKEAGLART